MHRHHIIILPWFLQLLLLLSVLTALANICLADFVDNVVYSHLFIPHTPSEGKFKSLPTPILQSDPITQVQRSFSLTVSSSHSPSTSYQVGSNSGNCFQPCQCSYSRLRHSNSAPIIGGQYRRRLSLQSLHSYGNEEVWSGAMPPSGKLRRISSETYVQRGVYVCVFAIPHNM